MTIYDSAIDAGGVVPPARLQVWDPFVRIFHWSLVGSIATALASGLFAPANWINLHLAAGTLAIALVTGRLVWGFIGPSRARFVDFVVGPRAFLHHVRELTTGRARRYVGHNPIGGVMILALLAAIIAIAATGALALGGTLKTGPFAFATTFAFGATALELHQILAFILIGLVALHVTGVVMESRRTRENLVRAMIDGHKDTRAGDLICARHQSAPLFAISLMTAILCAAAVTVVALANRPALGVPTARLDPLYAKECGVCHLAYHPSLAPAASWSAMMRGLASHFGENAELGPAEARAIRGYLIANAAETFDTKASNRLRRVDPRAPLRITATPFWKRNHAGMADAVFAAKAVGSRGACNTCHRDAAAGRFHPASINIPKEALP